MLACFLSLAVQKICLEKAGELPNKNSYNPQYVFKTNYLGREVELGFDCDSETGHVTYYNLTSNSIISSFEFETMMGDPSESVLSSIAQ